MNRIDCGRRMVMAGGWVVLCCIAQMAWGQGTENGMAGDEAEVSLGDWFLMTSHREPNQTDGLHLAVSREGLEWQVIHEDRSVLKPTVGEVFRDPSIARDDKGTYHLVWTIAWNCNRYKGIGYACSRDLIHWSEQRVIELMKDHDKTDFIWAPELFWDSQKKEWLIHWSSSVRDIFPETLALFNGHANPRIYYAVTKEFRTFTPSRLLFNGDCLAIDSYLYHEADQGYFMFFKADRREEPKRGILVAKAPAREGPYVVDPNMITAPEEGWAEGPCAVQFGEKVRLYYACQNYSSGYESKDMKHWMSIRQKMVTPGGYRHGTIIRISASEAARLMSYQYDN